MINRRIRIGQWLVPYDDAPAEVAVQRTVADVLTAQPGNDLECMNSRCIRAQRNEHVFPHPVYLVSTIKSRVYIVDRLDDAGEPAHAIRYELRRKDSALIEAHDRAGVGEPGELRLRVPRDPKGSPIRAASTPTGRYGTPDTTTGKAARKSGDGKSHRNIRPITRHGAAARVVAAVGSRTDTP